MKRHYLHLVMSLLAGACLAAASCSDSDEDTKLPSPNFPEAVSATIEAGGNLGSFGKEQFIIAAEHKYIHRFNLRIEGIRIFHIVAECKFQPKFAPGQVYAYTVARSHT